MNRIILKGGKQQIFHSLEVLSSPERFPKGLEKIRNSREEELKFWNSGYEVEHFGNSVVGYGYGAGQNEFRLK